MIADDPHFLLRLAREERDVLAAQRLRYEVFVAELGGDGPMVDHERRLERDEFDPHYDHLILVDTRRDARRWSMSWACTGCCPTTGRRRWGATIPKPNTILRR
jgi:hypothetical protein